MTAAAFERRSRPEATHATFNEQFRHAVERFADRVAFRLKTPTGYREVTYREVDGQASAVAAGLVEIGIRPGDRVAILSENRPEWVISCLGILMAGATVVPLDPQISPPEWRKLIEDSTAERVFVSGMYFSRFQEAVADSPLREKWTGFDACAGEKDGRRLLADFVSWAGSLDPAPELPPARVQGVAFIIYTSGTTGKPKGVVLTHENILSEIAGILRVVHCDDKDALLCMLPLQHVFASMVNVLTPLSVGAQVAFVDTLKRSEILQALQEAGITILATVPQFFYLFHSRILEELNKKPPVVRLLFRSTLLLNRYARRFLGFNLGKLLFGKIHRTFGARLRFFVSGGSSFDPRVAQDFHDLGFTVLQGYGLTETSGAATTTRAEDNVLGSVGKPLPGVEIKIVDPDESGVGDVAIRGKIVMNGYYRNPEATAQVWRDGWFFSGDLGRMDNRGNLFITGRKKEVIVLPNGKNIYPDELETHYLQNPYIEEIAVLGIASPGQYEGAERLHAVVVPNFEHLKARKIANAREILRDEIAALSNQLPKYKRLMSYQIQKDPLPRTTTRKIKRLELKRMIESGALQEAEPARPPETASPEDQALMASAVASEVLRCLREGHRRQMPVDPSMNLELDLGFDSMERVELLASLEQSLGVQLPEDFGAEIFTVRDLIVRLKERATDVAGVAGARRQSWKEILSDETLRHEGALDVRFSGPVLSRIKHLCVRMIYFFCRILFRLEVRGLENLPKGGAYLICPNHLSYLDSFVLVSAMPYRVFERTFFVGYSEHFQNWLMKFLARLANIVPVDPDAHLLRAMKVGARGLRQGRILCIFPEGGRSFDGMLQEFKKGAAILAGEVGVPMVPVRIEGTYEAWPRDTWKIRLHKIKLVFGQPLTASQGEASYEDDTRRLRDTVARLLS